MPTVHYSYHADLHEDVTTGLLVWDDRDVVYFTIKGDEKNAGYLNERLEIAKEHGTSISEIVEYWLDRPLGYGCSFSVPEQIEADDLQDAARKVAAASKHLKELIVDPVFRDYEVLDAEIVDDFVRTTVNGAHIHLFGDDWQARDTAFMAGLWDGPPMNVFSYLPYPVMIPPMPCLRFRVNRIERTQSGWMLQGRTFYPGDCPASAVIVEPVRDPDLLREMAQAWADLPSEVQEGLQQFLRSETDPTRV